MSGVVKHSVYGFEVRSLFAMSRVYKHLIIAQSEHTAGCSIVGRSRDGFRSVSNPRPAAPRNVRPDVVIPVPTETTSRVFYSVGGAI
jgi:hypothetical protein